MVQHMAGQERVRHAGIVHNTNKEGHGKEMPVKTTDMIRQTSKEPRAGLVELFNRGEELGNQTVNRNTAR